MKVEAYSSFEFWVEDSNKKRFPEREEQYVKGSQLNSLIVPIDTDLVFCIKKHKTGKRSAPKVAKEDFVAYLYVDGRELRTMYIKKHSPKIFKVDGVYGWSGSRLARTSLRLNPLPTTADAMAPALPRAMGKITLAIYEVKLKTRKSKKVPFVPFEDLEQVVHSANGPAAAQSPIYGIVKGVTDYCTKEDAKHALTQEYEIDQSAGVPDMEKDIWLKMEFQYRPDFHVPAPVQLVPREEFALLTQRVDAMEGDVGNLKDQVLSTTQAAPRINAVDQAQKVEEPSGNAAPHQDDSDDSDDSDDFDDSSDLFEGERSPSPLSQVTMEDWRGANWSQPFRRSMW